MDAVSALLRAAVRVADARAAIVAFDDDPTPVGFQGCSQTAAADAMRDGDGAHVDCDTPKRASTLILLEPQRPVLDDDALRAIARELGLALLDSQDRREGDLARLTASIEALPEAVAIFSPPADGEEVARFVNVNSAFTRLFGYTARELIGRSEDILFAPTTDMDSVMHVRDRLTTGDPVRSVLEMHTREDRPLWIEMSARVVPGDGGRPIYYASTLHDITARREFESSVAADKQRLSVTLRAIGDAVITALPDGRIDFLNAAAQRLLNVTFADAYGMPVRAVVDLRDGKDMPTEIAFDARGDVRGEGLLYGPERNSNIAFVSSPMRVSDGPPFGYVIVLRDVTAQHRLTRRLAYEASHDSLTRLPNRRVFEEMVDAALESARLAGHVHTIAFIDLDHFKLVNDRYGHAAGDDLLRDVARRMSLNVRGNDILARIGGDEFALLLHECTLGDAARIGEKLRVAVAHASIDAAGARVSLTASLGLAELDRFSPSAAAVVAAADAAAYSAKAGGRNRVVTSAELARESATLAG